MKKIHSRDYIVPLAAAIFICLAMAGCPPKPDTDTVVTTDRVETDPSLFIGGIRARTNKVTRLESRMETEIDGITGNFKGRFYGTALIESRTLELSMKLQVYTLLGVPALEMVSKGARIQIFSPLDKTVYANFTEVLRGGTVEEFPMSSFEDVAAPLEALKEQIELLFGLGFSDKFRYELSFNGENYVLTEWNGQSLLREMVYDKSGPNLIEVKAYRDGIPAGGMSCSDYSGSRADAPFLPRKIEISQGRISVKIKLSDIEVNEKVKSGPIDFRKPKDNKRLILLTPPVP